MQAQVPLTKPWWSQLKFEYYAQPQQVFVLQYPFSIVRMHKIMAAAKVCSKQPLNIKICRPNWTHLWIRITRFGGLSWSLHARRRCVLELAWDLCVVPWRKNDQNMSLKVTLFLCWLFFVLLRAFSDDTNSKQKTPHKEPCTWQISCWWDIRSLNYHSNKIAHELFTKWNPLV